MHVNLQILHWGWKKGPPKEELIDLQKLFNNYWSSKESQFTLPGQCDDQPVCSYLTMKAADVVVERNSVSLEFRFSASPPVRHLTTTYLSQLTMSAQGEPLRQSLRELEESMKEFSHVMSKSTERVVDKGIQLTTVFAAVSSPVWKMAGR